MGYTAQTFAVDIEKVKNVFGSKDNELLEKIKKSTLYKCYADQHEGDKFDEALKDIICNYINTNDLKKRNLLSSLFSKGKSSGLKTDLASEYGYVVLLICDTIGQHLSKGGDYFYAGDAWKEANELLTQNGSKINLDRMWQPKNLFDIPRITDFPVISHYSSYEIEHLLDVFTRIEIDEQKADVLSENTDDLHILLKAFRDGLLVCKKSNVEWVSFLH
jgi:hypothetical protein